MPLKSCFQELINNVVYWAVNFSSTLSSYSEKFQVTIVSSMEIIALFAISGLADIVEC